VLGSWVVAGLAAGMGIRDASTAVTNNLARFVPHIILD
jgi:glutathionylspermidine synthase